MLTNSEQRLLERITTIVQNEHRPVSFKDLLRFESNGKIVEYSNGSLRNLISNLLKEKEIIVIYRSPQAFYSIPGVTFGKNMRLNYIVRTSILNNRQKIFLNFLKIHNLEYPAIHDLRLTFVYKGLRTILTQYGNHLIHTIDESNKDIVLTNMTLDDMTLKITVHNTDKVSVTVACSNDPIPIDHLGLATLSSALTRIEERLQGPIDRFAKDNPDQFYNEYTIKTIPFHMDWTVVMWHFGYDSEMSYSGEMFEHTWKESIDVFRIYSKKRSVKRIQ
jgi:hypothetical protein